MDEHVAGGQGQERAPYDPMPHGPPEVGVGPWEGTWPEGERYDARLLAEGDRRNVVDRYRYWTLEAIVADLDLRRHGFHVAIENWQHDFNIGTIVRSANAFLGNVIGYEIGRWVGPPLYERDGRILKRKYFDQTSAFFDTHGNKAMVIGRFVPFVRTYITVVAGVTRMDRRRFFLWSAVGAVGWVLSITLLGYFLGQTFPWLKDNIDYAILAILAFSVVPIAYEWWRHKRSSGPDAEDRDHDGRPDIDIAGQWVPPRRSHAEDE